MSTQPPQPPQPPQPEPPAQPPQPQPPQPPPQQLQPPPPQQQQPPPPPPPAPASISTLKYQKLEQEIENLKIRNKWYRPLLAAIPSFALLVTAIVGLAGLWYSARKDRASQTQDKLSRIETRISHNVDQLLLFPHDDKQTISRAVFLFKDLKTLLESSYDDRKVSDSPDIKNNVVVSLYNLTEYDCDFDKTRDVDFDLAALTNLSEYAEFLSEHPDEHRYIFTKYAESLQRLCDQEHKFRTMRHNLLIHDFDFLSARPKQAHIDHFDDLTDAFKEHYLLLDRTANLSPEIIKKNLEVKQLAVRRFQIATCNPSFTAFRLGQSLDLTEDLSFIERCGNTQAARKRAGKQARKSA
jgi:hypothetical protein